MQIELCQRGLKAETESSINVHYKGVVVGEYRADLFVNDAVIVELKVAKSYMTEDEPQLLNELKATGIKVGLLINFGLRQGRVQTNGLLISSLSVFNLCSIRG